MKPKPFDYLRPETVSEAIQALRDYGDDARIVAGGQSLIAMLNLRLVEPRVLIDITRIRELGDIVVDGDHISIGAAVTQARLLAWAHLPRHAPFVAKALPWVGHFQTRNRGTVCGSIAHADPSSELPLSLALLGGEVVLRSRSGTRTLKASEFQLGMLQTARRSDELITEVRLPIGIGTKGSAFREVARRHGDFAIVGVGVVALDDRTIRLGIAGVADRPHVTEIPADAHANDIPAIVEQVAWQLGGYDDIHATARYRRDLLRRLAPQLVAEVRACAA